MKTNFLKILRTLSSNLQSNSFWADNPKLSSI